MIKENSTAHIANKYFNRVKNIIIYFLFLLFLLVSGISCNAEQYIKEKENQDSIVEQTINGSFDDKHTRYLQYQNFTGSPQLVWAEKAWKGERIYKQIVLWSSYKVQSLQYNISELSCNQNIIPSSSINLLFGKYVKGDPEPRRCSQYAKHLTEVYLIDALSDTKQTTLESNDPIKMWIVINIPKSIPAGDYTGNLVVTSDKATEITFTIKIKVIDRTLPSVENWSFHLDLWQYPLNILEITNSHNPANKIEMWSNEHLALLESAYKILYNCGQKVISAYIMDGALGAESMVKWIKKANGKWEYDFTAFDKYVTTLMSWGISKQINCFSPYGWNGGKISFWDESVNKKLIINTSPGSQEYTERWDHFLTEFRTHLVNRGWFDKTVLYMDEVSENELNKIIPVLHGNNPSWKLGIAYMSNLSDKIRSHFYDLSGFIEIASNNGITENKVSTFYTCCNPSIPNSFVTPENSTAEMSWMAWHALKENYSGYLRWAFDYWSLDDPFDTRDEPHTAGDYSLIYRDSNTPPIKYLPSLRLEMLRDGIEDYEKVKILRKEFSISQNPADIQKLYSLESQINKFDKHSGIQAFRLINETQKLLSDID